MTRYLDANRRRARALHQTDGSMTMAFLIRYYTGIGDLESRYTRIQRKSKRNRWEWLVRGRLKSCVSRPNAIYLLIIHECLSRHQGERG